MLIREIYNSVTSDLLERGGFQLGLVTDEIFLAHYQSVFEDYLQRISLAWTLHSQPQQFGVCDYDMPDHVGEVKQVFSAEKGLGRSTKAGVSNVNQRWMDDIGSPRTFIPDDESMGSVRLYPRPQLDGAPAAAVTPGYGTLSASSSSADVQFTCPSGGYGVISGDASGKVALMPAGPGFGTIARIDGSGRNLSVLATRAAFNKYPDLDYVVEWLPDSFALYLGYGILAKIFSTDGEMKNDQLARYCNARFEEGVALAKEISVERIRED